MQPGTWEPGGRSGIRVESKGEKLSVREARINVLNRSSHHSLLPTAPVTLYVALAISLSTAGGFSLNPSFAAHCCWVVCFPLPYIILLPLLLGSNLLLPFLRCPELPNKYLGDWVPMAHNTEGQCSKELTHLKASLEPQL